MDEFEITDDQLEGNDYWPIEGFWDAYDLGLSHGRQEGVWAERAPNWFDQDELDDYHEGYLRGRAGE